MAISKKQRFEVFKRDGFTCQYCGKTPPEIVLEIDHIKSRKRKGKDNEENLITACFDCNRGKGAIELKIAPPKTEEKLKLLMEKEKQLNEYLKLQEKQLRRIEKDIDFVNKAFEDLSKISKDPRYLNAFGRTQVKNALKRFNKHQVVEALEIAWQKDYVPIEDKLTYSFGVLWGKRKRGEI